jgi:hypothetical protein
MIASREWAAELLATRDWSDEPHTRAEVVHPPRGGMPQRSFGASD